MTTSFTDHEIVEAIQAGGLAGERALNFLYRNFKSSIVMLVKRNSGTEEEAVDVFQDAVVTVYDNIRNRKFRGESALGSYLYSIARFIWLNQLKRKKRAQEIIDNQTYETVETSHLRVIFEMERNEMLGKILEEAGRSCKEILIYSIYYGYSMLEIKEKMGYENEQVARNKKYRCLKNLKAMVVKRPDLKDFLKED